MGSLYAAYKEALEFFGVHKSFVLIWVTNMSSGNSFGPGLKLYTFMK